MHVVEWHWIIFCIANVDAPPSYLFTLSKIKPVVYLNIIGPTSYRWVYFIGVPKSWEDLCLWFSWHDILEGTQKLNGILAPRAPPSVGTRSGAASPSLRHWLSDFYCLHNDCCWKIWKLIFISNAIMTMSSYISWIKRYIIGGRDVFFNLKPG